MADEAIDWRRLYSGGLDDVGDEEQEAAAVRLGLDPHELDWSRTTSADRGRLFRARRRGELPPHEANPVNNVDLAANCIRRLVRPELGPCLEWGRGRISSGYGLLQLNGVKVYAHRLSLERKLGRPIGRDMQACHTCDNPPCIAPEHLFEGTISDNARDMHAKGRHPGWRRKEGG